jgi:hypothetical protein
MSNYCIGSIDGLVVRGPKSRQSEPVGQDHQSSCWCYYGHAVKTEEQRTHLDMLDNDQRTIEEKSKEVEREEKGEKGETPNYRPRIYNKYQNLPGSLDLVSM